jgi:uncharacterized membrane protein (UPF0182 family)
MRVPTDMPKRRRRTSGRGRVIFIVVALVLFLLITSLRGVAGFWTDYLWFESLELESVFTGILGAKIALGAIFTGVFFVLCFLSLTVADKVAPKFRPQGPEDELLNRYHATVGRRAGLVRAGVSLVFGLVAGVGVSGEWQQWLLFRNGGDFGLQDQTFQTDVGFYVFKLPFYSTVVNWLFASGVIILIITVVAHYINGGIRLQSPLQRVTPAVKGHISVILALLALIKAADYWLQRYALTYSTRGTVDGALYTDVKAQLPAIYLLLIIALLSFGLFIYNIWRRGWVLPVIAVGLWALVAVVAGTAYPAFIQRFTVEPGESSKEAPYITHNIDATRAAMGLDRVDTQPFDYSEDRTEAIQAVNDNQGTIRNIRLLDPSIVRPTFQSLQSQEAGYQFNELDVDRYQVLRPDGQGYEETQVVIGTRDLDVGGIPQQSWEGRHLAYTHGYGVAVAPANATTEEGRPDFIVENVPVDIEPPGAVTETLDRPQLYYGENLPGYAITNTDRQEVDFAIGGQAQATAYDGTGGVHLDSWLRTAAFAARFGDWNLLISDFVTPESRIVFQRDVNERVREIAPFLEFDADPYPVMNNGRIVYIFDAYTTTDRYPNAQRADTGNVASNSGLNGKRFNYVRNSVKGVVDAYDGTVTLYVVDPTDPLAVAYQKAFPDLFRSVEDFPAELREHWRYPEDLFRVQTNMWGRYHIDNPAEFYERTASWSVAQDPGQGTGGAGTTVQPQTQAIPGQGIVRTRENRMDPYFMHLKLPGDDDVSFVSLRPYVPYSEDDTKRTLTAFMVASSEPDRYGQLTVYEMPPGTNIDGPSIVNSNILSNREVSAAITQLNQQGSRVQLGNMLLLPINNSILYVRPFYVASENATQLPELRNVIVAFNQQVVMNRTLRGALEQLFPGVSPETFEAVGEGDTTPEEEEDPNVPGQPSEPGTPTTPQDQTVASLLADAGRLLDEAEAKLRESGDLGAYQTAVKQAAALIAQAQQLQNGTTTGTSPSTTSPSTSVPSEGESPPTTASPDLSPTTVSTAVPATLAARPPGGT